MTDTLSLIIQTLSEVENTITIPFWKKWEFWLTTLIGLLSVFFSYIAFKEAKQAKEAASEAGKTVKIQTVTIELTELIQRLDSLNMDIRFNEARDLLNEVNRRVKRIISPFKNETEYKETCGKITNSLNEIRQGLENVRPVEGAQDSGYSIYYGIEGSFSNLSGLLAELTGLLEQRTIEK